MAEPMIEVSGVRKAFGETKALAGVDLSVPEGGVLALLGPNGAGKTTLVRVLTTLLQPDTGWAKVAGYDVVKQATQLRSSSAWPASRRRWTRCSPAGRTWSWSAASTT